MKKPSIHLIIPTHNRAEVLKEIGPRYYSKLPLVDRIVVVNDASTDETAEVLAEWSKADPRVVPINSREHIGLPAARNLGLEHCEGSHIMFGEDDLFFEADATAIMLREMEAIGSDIIACRLFQQPESVERIGMVDKKNLSSTPHLLDDRYLYGHYDAELTETIFCPFVHACFLARREVFQDLRFDAEIGFDHFREETDFQLTAWEAGFTVAFTPLTRCYHLPLKLRAGGCHTARRSVGPLKDQMRRFKNNHNLWKRHENFLSSVFTRFSRRQAELLFLAHCLANAGHSKVSMLKQENRKAGAKLLSILLKPAALVELLTAPRKGYGSIPLAELEDILSSGDFQEKRVSDLSEETPR